MSQYTPGANNLGCIDVKDLLSFILSVHFQQCSSEGLFCLDLTFPEGLAFSYSMGSPKIRDDSYVVVCGFLMVMFCQKDQTFGSTLRLVTATLTPPQIPWFSPSSHDHDLQVPLIGCMSDPNCYNPGFAFFPLSPISNHTMPP